MQRSLVELNDAVIVIVLRKLGELCKIDTKY